MAEDRVAELDAQFTRLLPGYFQSSFVGCGQSWWRFSVDLNADGTFSDFKEAQGGARSAKRDIQCKEGKWVVKGGNCRLFTPEGKQIFIANVGWPNWYQTCRHLTEATMTDLCAKYKEVQGDDEDDIDEEEEFGG